MAEHIRDGTGESQYAWKIDVDNAGYVKLINSEGEVVDLSITTEGNLISLNSSDINTQSILNSILKELKKINVNLSDMNDNYIKDEDVE